MKVYKFVEETQKTKELFKYHIGMKYIYFSETKCMIFYGTFAIKFTVNYYKTWWFFLHVQFISTVLELSFHLNPTLLTVSHMDKGCSQKGFPIYSDMAWNIKF